MHETRSKISIGCPGFSRPKEAALQTGMILAWKSLQDHFKNSFSVDTVPRAS